ncbi:MAG: cytochrome c biogenesis protein [Patescibacteria group bacterium]|nr:cytochrome c biogenesis protein [Patescibacteria group bacterium]MDD5121671.1 cytochrome c biogenesis protein [Patescibacteria group bacterium]MDD5222234.1 cytochrome c biogenesis protein [Patescibacteria group bacterium]MDD5396165.1 cytochrome c biogenesis protein [Patescibacteria group bacterium]
MNLKSIYKKFIIIFILTVFCIIFSIKVNAQNNLNNQNDVSLHMFYGQGCPHCSKLKLFLDNMRNKYSSLKIYEHEVYQDPEGRKLFEQMSQAFNTPIKGVPTVFIDDKVIIGFSNEIGDSIENEIKRCLEADCIDPELMVNKSFPDNFGKNEIVKKLTIPIVVSAAAVDAINPCAFAVLIILMTAVLSISSRKKALNFGLAFTASVYISYFLIGLGLFSALQISGLSHKFYIVVTILAFIVGLLNIKDYFWYGKGFLMEIPLRWRPTIKRILNSVTTPFGAFIAGFAISLFELPCTGGPYIVILGLLAKEVTRSTGIFYLLIYNLVFVSPLIILSLIIYKGLSTASKLEAIRQKKIKLLHLIAGILMLGVATAMVISLIKGWV